MSGLDAKGLRELLEASESAEREWNAAIKRGASVAEQYRLRQIAAAACAAMEQAAIEALPGLLDRLEAVEAEARMAGAQRDVYAQAINEIDDRTEYRAFTRADISLILDRLSRRLVALAEPQP